MADTGDAGMTYDERQQAIFLLGPWVRDTTIIEAVIDFSTADRFASGPSYTRGPIQSGKKNRSSIIN
jgi:hypothetical protein